MHDRSISGSDTGCTQRSSPHASSGLRYTASFRGRLRSTSKRERCTTTEAAPIAVRRSVKGSSSRSRIESSSAVLAAISGRSSWPAWIAVAITWFGKPVNEQSGRTYVGLPGCGALYPNRTPCAERPGGGEAALADQVRHVVEGSTPAHDDHGPAATAAARPRAVDTGTSEHLGDDGGGRFVAEPHRVVPRVTGGHDPADCVELTPAER